MASPWQWQCHRCQVMYNIAVTRRCLSCTATLSIGTSRSSPRRRRRRLRANKKTPNVEFDYDFWTIKNDWSRFRTAFVEDPAAWKRRSMRELGDSSGKERKVKRAQLEHERRLEITEERRRRFVRKTYNCEKDCDYPSQCHHERYRAFMSVSDADIEENLSDELVGKIIPPADGDLEEIAPICGILQPEIDTPEPVINTPKMDITTPEHVDETDDIIMAYEDREQDAWFTHSPRTPDSNDHSSSSSDEGDELKDQPNAARKGKKRA
ncbi:hypothetical protein FZEAL_726 [Fusarium zealandicum]|uniref:Uncharacterized protein n=1 Tax=Fusarium zealandicum TaxID=1053134 RepID=A0A8H4XQL1_9HYPO|nr:hypothetical protein FZEAL_726 [Fusarium zealandicum]